MPPPDDLARRRALLTAALGFALLDTRGTPPAGSVSEAVGNPPQEIEHTPRNRGEHEAYGKVDDEDDTDYGRRRFKVPR